MGWDAHKIYASKLIISSICVNFDNSLPCWLNWIERKTSNLEVLGSSPRWGAYFFNYLENIPIFPTTIEVSRTTPQTGANYKTLTPTLCNHGTILPFNAIIFDFCVLTSCFLFILS